MIHLVFPRKRCALGAFIAVAMPLALLPACTTMTATSIDDFLVMREVPYPKRDGLTVCHGATCTYRTKVSLAPATWGRVRAVFSPRPMSAADERERVVQAVAILETAVGARAGFSLDAPRNDYLGFEIGRPRRTQLDCVDEATNTTAYLLLMRDDGLLTWNAPSPPNRRGSLWDGRWPHFTAVLTDRKSGEKFAIDTWFRSNGERAYVVRLNDWLSGSGFPKYSLTALDLPVPGKTSRDDRP